MVNFHLNFFLCELYILVKWLYTYYRSLNFCAFQIPLVLYIFDQMKPYLSQIQTEK